MFSFYSTLQLKCLFVYLKPECPNSDDAEEVFFTDWRFYQEDETQKQFEDENDNMQNMFITDSGLQSSATVPKWKPQRSNSVNTVIM